MTVWNGMYKQKKRRLFSKAFWFDLDFLVLVFFFLWWLVLACCFVVAFFPTKPRISSIENNYLIIFKLFSLTLLEERRSFMHKYLQMCIYTSVYLSS